MLRQSQKSIEVALSNNNVNNSANPLDALPKQFVLSMKKLFDILDDQHCGYVKLTDIEKGWQDDGSKGLPQGVIASLRKVTPPSGLLSFERFCAGLKLCLIRQQQQQPNVSNVKTAMHTLRPPSAPLLEFENSVHGCAPTATVRPRSHSIQFNSQRAISMPMLSPDSEIEVDYTAQSVISTYNTPAPPPKPPRVATIKNCPPMPTKPNHNGPLQAINKSEIRHALQNWQMGILLNELDTKDKIAHKQNHIVQLDYRGLADGGSSSATDSGSSMALQQAKKATSKRREPRRHTLQNGIDYNMLKRLKLFEEERELLLLGLEGVEKARDWYMDQVLNVQEKIKYFGRMDTRFDQVSEMQQERLNFQRARVIEVNRSLSSLTDTWERGGYPFHINLAIRTPNKVQNKRYSSSTDEHLLLPFDLLPAGRETLEKQNRHLTHEINLKSDRILHLEREKQTLMHELYDLQQRFGIVRKTRNVNNFVLSQPSPVSQSSSGLDDADVVY